MALYVILGPPAAGKTTWVNEHAQPGDIVVDFDRLANALTAPGADEHDHTKPLRSVTHQARSAAITTALRHVSNVDVYIIHSAPRPEALSKYERHHARMVTINPGRDIVLARCSQQRSPWTMAIAESWYDTHGDNTSGSISSSPTGSRDW